MTSKIPIYDGSTDPEEWINKFKAIRAIKGAEWGNDEAAIKTRSQNEVKIAKSGKMTQ